MNMDTHRSLKFVSAFIFVFPGLILTACAPRPTPALFIPPADQTESIPTSTQPFQATLPPPPLTPTNTPIVTAAPTTCLNDLTFVQDLTVPDGSIILPGGGIDKQWLVQNSGTCNWDASYRFKLIGGDSLGAQAEQALFPARAGGQATLRILFTAPLVIGTYQSAWQAFAPDGTPFGDTVFMQIIVSQ
jgi:hypothetical protein